MKKNPIFYTVILLALFCSSALSGQGLGDVNADASVNIVDALLVAQYYVGLAPSPFYAQFADATANGTVDIIDALLIAKYYVGIIPNFPVYAYPLDSKYQVISVPVIDATT
jgi:hypothetical protein